MFAFIRPTLPCTAFSTTIRHRPFDFDRHWPDKAAEMWPSPYPPPHPHLTMNVSDFCGTCALRQCWRGNGTVFFFFFFFFFFLIYKRAKRNRFCLIYFEFLNFFFFFFWNGFVVLSFWSFYLCCLVLFCFFFFKFTSRLRSRLNISR